jgi:hypothetical protein
VPAVAGTWCRHCQSMGWPCIRMSAPSCDSPPAPGLPFRSSFESTSSSS